MDRIGAQLVIAVLSFLGLFMATGVSQNLSERLVRMVWLCTAITGIAGLMIEANR